jgi:hypothetical protein
VTAAPHGILPALLSAKVLERMFGADDDSDTVL